MSKVLIVAPHADDETLGCGGTILSYKKAGKEVYWLIVTSIKEQFGFSAEQALKRQQEVKQVSEQYSFNEVFELNFPPAALETIPKGQLIGAISDIINSVQPTEVFTAFRNDAHSDHEVVYDAVMSATKSFRYPFVKKVLAYETISETDFGMKPEGSSFRANLFIDISDHLNKKLDILEIFESEIQEFPFPRSRKSLSSLAYLRGSQSNCNAAEAYMLIKEIP